MNFEEFLKPKENDASLDVWARSDSIPVQEEKDPEETESKIEDIDVQKAVVEELAADKAVLDDEIVNLKHEIERLGNALKEKETAETSLKNEVSSLKVSLASKEAELSAEKAKEADTQERNPNALALLDRDTDLPDRFPGETRDHVLEVLREARDKAEAEGRVRRAQLLEGVLVANESNGTLAKKRAALEKLFSDNGNVLTGPVIEELARCSISHKNGEEYLLPSEILKRTY